RHNKAVVLRGDLDTAGLQVLDRVIAAAMTEMHLDGARAEGKGKQLMPEADAEDRYPRGEQFAQHGDGENAGRRWVAGTVAQEDAVGPQGEDRGGRRTGRHDRDATAEAAEAAQDVALDAVVDADDMTVRGRALSVTVLDGPRGLRPFVRLVARHLARQIH